MKLVRALTYALVRRRIIEYRYDLLLAVLSAFLLGVGLGTLASVGASL